MAHYLITLVVETEPAEGSPGDWPWQEVIDSPLPVTVVACTGIADDPSEDEVEELHERVGLVHRDLAAHLG